MKNMLFIISLTFLMSSCLEVLELKHDDSNPVLVIDGQISNQPGPYSVKVTTTTSFNSSDQSSVVNDASVVISDDAGNEELLSYQGDGVYKTASMQGVVGRTYFLAVQYAGQTYDAQSTLLPLSQIDTLYSTFVKENSLQKEGYYLSLAAKVFNPDIINYYRWKIYEGDSLYSGVDDIIIEDDQYIERSLKEGKIEFQLQYPFEIGDSVTIEVLSLNEDAYKYYRGLIEILQSDGGLFSPPPVNAPSNISNGALGLFQTNSISKSALVINK